MNKQEAVKTLINMALSHLGHGTDDFVKKSLDFYKLIREQEKVAFIVGHKYGIVFYFQDEESEEKSVEVIVWEHFSGEKPTKRIARSQQFGFKENNAHLAFLKLIGGLQKELRNAKTE